MSTHTQGRNKALYTRGIPKNDKIIRNDTIITPDNKQILLEKTTLTMIANNISKKTGNRVNINSLVTLIKSMDYTRLYNKNYQDSITEISKLYMTPNQNKPNLYIDNLDNETPTVTDYLKRQTLYMTGNENQYKYTQNVARRGDSIIYTDLQDKINDNTRQLHNLSDEDFKGKILNGVENLQKFFDPMNIDALVKRAGAAPPGLQTYQNITFPRRLVRFDSMNRLVNSTNTCIQWRLNFSGHQGQKGDIYVQDTIKEIKRIQFFPFWLPIIDPKDIYYNTISLYIKEFWDAVSSSHILSDNINNEKYHFQFNIEKVEPTRIYLTPIQPFYNFSKSIGSIERISTVFYNPFNEIIFDNMDGVYSVVNGVLTTFTLLNGDHNLTTGDLVYILNYNSTDSNINDEINNSRGHIITVTGINTFTIPIDTSLLAAVQDVNITYGSKRIFFQMEFTSLEH